MPDLHDGSSETRRRPLRLIVVAWSWLGQNSAPISSVGVIAQTLVVIAGVMIAVHQLRILVDSEGRTAIRKTATYWDENSSILDSLHRLSRKYDDQPNVLSHPDKFEDFANEFSRAAPVFRNLELCLETRECDENLAKRLFCPVAVHAATAGGLSHEVSMTYDDLEMYHFATRCFPECRGDGTSESWLRAYRELFPDSEAERSGRFERRPDEVRSDYLCSFSEGRANERR